ncbi:hypothetical protein Pcinc_019284 [Petrolisthes cinctipes]|uniref:Uncharacterized protein n=1 Tax=Petrolisthes cinctipes TaxID=88211 RepID=A0AAE1FLW3_PETCI|nr:hypothetical protein Pcinc_019284 [Petrolisthes cinctipes]
MDKHLDMRMIEDYPRPGGSCRMREKMIGRELWSAVVQDTYQPSLLFILPSIYNNNSRHHYRLLCVVREENKREEKNMREEDTTSSILL